MNNDTMKDIINDVRDLASVSDTMTRLGLDSIATKLEKLVADAHPKAEASSEGSDQSELNQSLKLTRAAAVRVLMEFQRSAAHEGFPELVEALSMAVSNIVRRQRQSCRNKALRTVERSAEAAKKEVAA